MECPPNVACESEARTCPKAFWRATLLGGGVRGGRQPQELLTLPPLLFQSRKRRLVKLGKAKQRRAPEAKFRQSDLTRVGAGEMNKEGRESTWLWA